MAAKMGHQHSCHMLKLMYEKGLGVEKDYVKAAYWSRLNAKRGLYSGLQDRYGSGNDSWLTSDKRVYILREMREFLGMISVIQLDGDSYEKEIYRKEIYKKLDPKSEDNRSQFQLKIGLMHYYGYILKQDYVKAMNMFIVASNKGNSLASIFAGYMYECGYGVEQDYRKAFEFYKKSQAEFDPVSYFFLHYLPLNFEDFRDN